MMLIKNKSDLNPEFAGIDSTLCDLPNDLLLSLNFQILTQARSKNAKKK